MPDTDETETEAGPPDAAHVRMLLKEVRDLARALEGTATSRLRIVAGSLQVDIAREAGVVPVSAAGLASPPAAAAAAAPGAMPVVAPLVGVFYRASSPGARPFVEVGDTVERGQTVCIIEAMKVMNEVTSDFRGTVASILVEDGEAVQYEQPLLSIDMGG